MFIMNSIEKSKNICSLRTNATYKNIQRFNNCGEIRFLESTLDKSKWKKVSSEAFSWDHMSNTATYFWHDDFWSKQDFQKLAAEQLIESRAIEFSGHTVILTLKLLEIHCKNNVIVMMITSIITIAGLLSNSWKYQLIKRRCPVLTSYWLEPYLLRQSISLRKQPTSLARRHHWFPP